MNPNIQNPIQVPIEKPKNKIWGIIYDLVLTGAYLLFLYQSFLPYLNQYSGCEGETFYLCELSYLPINKIIIPVVLITFLYLSRVLRNYKKSFGFIMFLLSSLSMFFVYQPTFLIYDSELIYILILIITGILGIILFLSKNSPLSFGKRILIQSILIICLIGPLLLNQVIYNGCDPSSCISENPNGITCPPGTVKVGNNNCE